MWQYNPTNELMHFGKKGMRWGKRSNAGPRSEADTARSLAKGYTNAMDKRAAKRPEKISRQQEAKTAHKIADKYTTAMDKKENKSKDTTTKKQLIEQLAGGIVGAMAGTVVSANLGGVSVGHSVVAVMLGSAIGMTAVEKLQK